MFLRNKRILTYIVLVTSIVITTNFVLLTTNSTNKSTKTDKVDESNVQTSQENSSKEEIDKGTTTTDNSSSNGRAVNSSNISVKSKKETDLYNAIIAIIDEKIQAIKDTSSIAEQLIVDIENKNILELEVYDTIVMATRNDGTKIELSQKESEKYMSVIETTAKENNLDIIHTKSNPSFFASPFFHTTNTLLLFIMLFASFRLYSIGKREKEYSPRTIIHSRDKERDREKDDDIPDVDFDDLQGCQELKKNVQDIISYLKNPEKLVHIGARMPKGIVLYGPPGTGKTLTAKAIAGTAGVSFISASGSDFIEMYVGVGAKRVRELFSEARAKAPCIVFIDEIDAVGGKRGDSNNSERDQTINALLTELDGFAGSEGILTICATNRVDMLDPALIRSGRFDLHLAVPLPDKNDRLSILKVHARDKQISESVDFELIASKTIGFSGADLESLLNEAALTAVSKDKDCIDDDDIDRAFFKMVMKGDKKEDTSIRDREELNIVAYHEAGHTLVSKIICKEEVPMVTIISSTSGAGGVTFRNPKETALLSKKHLRNLIMTTYGGRAAEEIYYGNDDDITTGASNDIKQATEMIYNYICTYGMGDSGMLNLDMISRAGILPDKTVDNMMELSKKIYKETLEFLSKNTDLLIDLSEELLINETLNDGEINKVIEKHKVILN